MNRAYMRVGVTTAVLAGMIGAGVAMPVQAAEASPRCGYFAGHYEGYWSGGQREPENFYRHCTDSGSTIRIKVEYSGDGWWGWTSKDSYELCVRPGDTALYPPDGDSFVRNAVPDGGHGCDLPRS